MHPKRILITLAVLACVAGLVAATASAEPKNQWPFTRPVSSHVAGEIVTSIPAAAVPAGEPKNEAPFVNRVSADPGYAVALHEISAYYARPESSAAIRPTAGSATSVGAGIAFHGTRPALLGAGALALGVIGLAAFRRRSPGLS